MERILDDVRLDAISKLKEEKVWQGQLEDAVTTIITLSATARREGLLALEEAAEKVSSEFLKQLIMFVVDGTEPALIAEIATNEYWTNAPEGAQAMAEYMYLRGILGIQAGENDRLLKEVLLSLMPLEQRKKYKAQMDRAEGEPGITRREAIAEKFVNSSLEIYDKKVLENIYALEREIQMLPDRSVQRLLREVDNRVLAVCTYAVKEETRRKILDNLSVRLAGMIMEEVVCNMPVTEKEVGESIKKVQLIIETLQRDGEIYMVPAQ